MSKRHLYDQTRRHLGRRVFLTDLGRGTLFVAGFGLFAACGGDDDDAEPAARSTPTPTPTPPATSTSTDGGEATATASTTATAAEDSGGGTAGAVDWERVNLGFVSAYILVRNGEAALIDTGTSGSAGMIEATLEAAGVGWSDLGHVIVTHSHNDHQGSLTAVLNAAPGATPYAGTADIPAISAPRPPSAVGNGDRVFGLDVIETPGHTAGHISLLDPVGGLLVAGDALNGADGGVVGPNPSFSSNHTQALESVGVLAGFEYETLVFGHGEPVLANASALVTELAASL
jgi:glyoxylase-like metal-dependent hydrolase (beta-lactamase superfamily II)